MAKSILIALLVAPALSLVAPRPLTRRSALHAEVADVAEEAPPPLTDAQADAKKETLEFLSTRYFFGRVSIYLGPQYKPLNEIFEPSRKDDTTAIASVVVPTPFGMVIEESASYKGKIEVIDVVPDGNAAKAGIRVGDILRGTTGMALNIQQASEEDFGFSVGLSEGTKQIAFLPTDRKNFDSVMSALQTIQPGSFEPFNILEVSARGSDASVLELWKAFSQINYFAFICLTTVGFGDIQPVLPASRMLSVVTGMIGPFYLAVVIGVLTGRYSNQVEEKEIFEHDDQR